MVVRALAFCALAVTVAMPLAARAYDDMYSRAELIKDAARLATAVRKIYRIGLEPALRPEERRRLGRVVFDFPMPDHNSELLNFYAYRDTQQSHVIMPMLSLKQLEDLTTAYAWLHAKKFSLSTIDMYFAMLRHKSIVDWPQGRFPEPLRALGVPKLAYKEPGVDVTSLSLRNEAFAFIIAHELAHILYRHQPYSKITKAQARADELQSDQFALDLMARTNTAPMGGVLFFRAQVYGMPHRGSFASAKEWNTYLRTKATHPLSTARITNMADFIATTFAQRRPGEAATWRWIGRSLRSVSRILDDVDIQRCIVKTAASSSLDTLKPRTSRIGIEACM